MLTSGEANACKMADEECETDTDRCNEGGTVLLCGEHEDGEDEQGGQEHLDEEATGDGRVFGQSRCDSEFLS